MSFATLLRPNLSLLPLKSRLNLETSCGGSHSVVSVHSSIRSRVVDLITPLTSMRISEASHHLKKTSLWDNDNQAEAEAELTTPEILTKATATIRASLGVNNPQNIWAALGLHLQKQLFQHNSVKITDFGAFGFNQNDEPMFVQDPVFLHMTRLCLASRKRGDRVQPALSPSENVVDIDLNEIAAEHRQNCSKDLLKSVISSVFAWVVAWAKDGQEMHLSFLPVGEWVCGGDSVDFHFSESFRKDLELAKEEEESRIAKATAGSDIGDNNQPEGEEPDCDQSAIFPLSARTIATTKSPSSKVESIAGGSSVSNAKVAATRSGSPVGRSRYKLRAPTFSSIAKQLPPHSQRRIRTKATVKGPSSTNKTKVAKSVASRPAVHNRKQVEPASPTFNAAEIEAVAEDIVAAMKNARPNTVSSTRTCKSKQSALTTSHPTSQHVETIARLRKRISNRRSKTTQGLNAIVAVFSPFKTGAISSAELSLSLRKLGVKISSAELKEITAAFAHEKRGYVDTSQLLSALRGPPLSDARLDLVMKAFHKMDPACTGAVHIDELIKHYDVSSLPQVRDGKQSRLEAITAFLQEWAFINPATTNTITFETFVEYYHNLSACIDNDDDFARLMQQAWRISEENQEQENQLPSGEDGKNVPPTASIAMSATPRVCLPLSSQAENLHHAPENSTGSKIILEEKLSPSEAWAYLRALLLFPHRYQVGASSWPTLDNMCRRLGANRVLGDGNETMNVKAFAHALIALDKRLPHKKAYELSQFVAASCAKGLGDSDTIVLLSLYRTLMTTSNETSIAESSVDYNYVEYYASRAIARIRARVRRPSNNVDTESPVDLNTLEKWLQVSGSNGDSNLLKYELRSGLQKVGIDISYQDLDYLFAYFDVDRQGFINYEIFLEALRCPSTKLPKRAKRQETSPVNSEAKPANIPAESQQLTSLVYTVAPQTMVRRNKPVAREPQPNFRRRNLIHRAIWDQSKREAPSGTDDSFSELEIERHHRYRAAQVIQTMFRAFRARQIVAQLRRTVTAKSYCFNALAQEQQQLLAKKMKTNRTALPTAYGF